MSRTAQGVIAVKQCRFPPLFGYKTEVSQGAVRTLSVTNLANLTAREGEREAISGHSIQI